MADEVFRDMLIEEIQKHLSPATDREKIVNAADTIIEDGCQALSDLHLVEVDDIISHLSKHDCRKLVAAWKQRESVSAANKEPTAPGVAVVPLRHSSFTFNYNKLPDSLLNMIKQNKALDNKKLNVCVELIVDNVMANVPNVERGFFKGVAADIVMDHPRSFNEIHVGNKSRRNLSTPTEKLNYKLVNRFDNINRMERPIESKEAPKIQQAYGCVRWRVLSLPEGETEETLETAAQEMRDTYATTRRNRIDWDTELTKLTRTYGMQRGLINSQTPRPRIRKRRRAAEEEENADEPDEPEPVVATSEIQDKFPLLFCYNGMIHHFVMLTQVDFEERLQNWFPGVQDTLVDFLATGNQENMKLKGQLSRIKKRLDSDEEKEDKELLTIILMLENYFGTTSNLLIQRVEIGTRIHEIVDVPATPCIFAVGQKVLKSDKYFLSIDGMVRCAVQTFAMALGFMFCSYFNFNITYPEDAPFTLEFIQRCILNHNPPSGSKVPRRKRGPNTVSFKLHKLNTDYKAYVDGICNSSDSEEDE